MYLKLYIYLIPKLGVSFLSCKGMVAQASPGRVGNCTSVVDPPSSTSFFFCFFSFFLFGLVLFFHLEGGGGGST